MNSNFVTSLIRTYVPIIAGALISYLLSKGIDLDEGARTGLVTFLTALSQGLYYLLVRLFEKYVSPQFGWLLGQAKQVKYVEPK